MSPDTPSDPDFHDLDLVSALRGALSTDDPLDLLVGASSIAVALDADPDEPHSSPLSPRHAPRDDETSETLQFFASRLLDSPSPETDALLRVWTEMLGDELLSRRIASVLKLRDQGTPDWLARIDELTTTRAVSSLHVLGHEETIFVGVATASEPFTIAVAIDRSGMPYLEDAYAIGRPIADVMGLTDEQGFDMESQDLPLRDARARIDEAVDMSDRMVPHVESETWPAMRRLLQWVVRLMPEGGQGFDLHEWDEDEIRELVDGFMRSPWATGLGEDAAFHAQVLLQFQADYGSNLPLRWGSDFTARVLMDLFPRKVMTSDASLLAMPATLRALVQYANDRSGIPSHITANVLETLDELEVPYRTSVLDADEDDPSSLETTQELFASLLGGPGTFIDFYTGMLGELEEEVGGADALRTLGLEPLPREDLDTTGIPQDIRPRVRSLADQVADLAESYFEDPEMRTAALRVLAAAATNGPEVFRRRFTDPPTTAAICWITGRVNHWFVHSDPARTVTALMRRAEVKSSPSQRADALRSAIRPVQEDDPTDEDDWTPADEWTLGDAALLTSTARRFLSEQRDRMTAELAILQEDDEEH